MTMRSVPMALLAATLWTPLLAADQIRLKNGNVLEGTIKSRTEQQVIITLPEMGDLTISASEILTIEAGDVEPAGAAAEPEDAPGDLQLFHNGQRGVRLYYPKGWHVTEHQDQHPYVVTVVPAPPAAPDEPPPAVIELLKHYHASGTMGFDHQATDEELLDRAQEHFVKAGGRVTQSAPWEMPRATARLMDGEIRRPGRPAFRARVLLMARRDALVTLLCQALPWAFEAHQAVFDRVVEQVQPFATAQADNAQLDRRTRAIEQKGLRALQSGDAEAGLEHLLQAVTLNPGVPTHHLNFGTALMAVGQQAVPDQRNALFSRAEQELRLAVALYPVIDGLESSAPQRAQALYLLGELAAFGRGSHGLAKQMYEAALEADPTHAGAQQAMQRYQAPGP